jgi:hypothetical protein
MLGSFYYEVKVKCRVKIHAFYKLVNYGTHRLNNHGQTTLVFVAAIEARRVSHGRTKGEALAPRLNQKAGGEFTANAGSSTGPAAG